MSKLVNHWHDSKCAKAFWSQGEMPAYDQLLADTLDWTDPAPGQTWLDLGCGGGRLARALWEKSQGRLGRVIALDLAEANRSVIARMAEELGTRSIEFRRGDLSQGLPDFADASLDGVVSGLAIQYAEHYCEQTSRWTRQGYQRLLDDVCRALKPGGTFTFSVNVPRPAWLRLSLSGAVGVFRTGRPVKYLKNTLRMLRYGAWLKREAHRGRFHYLPEETVRACLTEAGFAGVEARRSYAGLAYVFRASRPA
jgi:ubiquinone/menaquinone biosynthesis C-methylase UbiE